MGLNFDGDAKSEDDFQSGPARPKPGKYHAVINFVDESGISDDPDVRSQSKSEGKVVIGFKILAGTLPGQEGTELREYFPTSEKALPRLKKLAYVTGLLATGDKGKTISFEDARGSQLIIEVESHTYQGEERVQLAFYGMWSLGHRDVKDVPVGKDAAALASIEDGEKVVLDAPQTAASGSSIDDIEL